MKILSHFMKIRLFLKFKFCIFIYIYNQQLFMIL